MRPILEVVRRNLQIELSYRFYVIFRLAEVAFFAFIFFFVARMVDRPGHPWLARYGTGYFPFVASGLMLSKWFEVVLNALPMAIRQEQVLGTLEWIAMSPGGWRGLVAGSAISQGLLATIEIGTYLGLIALLGHVPGFAPDWLSLSLVFLATAIMGLGLGLLSSSFVLVFKRGDPVNWLIGLSFALLGGAYFPVEVFPDWIRKLTAFVPFTYAVEGARSSLFGTAAPPPSYPPLILLSIFGALFLAAGGFAFRWAIRRTRKDGTLAAY